MTATRGLVLCGLVLLGLAAVHGALPYYYPFLTHASNHSVAQGWRQFGDRILHRELVRRSASFLRVVTQEWRWPPKGLANATITYVSAADLLQDGTGGYVNVTFGGVGLREVGLRFKSQRGSGFSFLVEVYGR
ncbi:probable salivary secreted peptide [Bacillus rossius redtenbacheri]|uniref:probable salivary secreted peptide n=1 Tax=Bacillus rossius redtenbacheri TaxID=93214 RepID=UPI002FDEB26D